MLARYLTGRWGNGGIEELGSCGSAALWPPVTLEHRARRFYIGQGDGWHLTVPDWSPDAEQQPYASVQARPALTRNLGYLSRLEGDFLRV